MKSVWGNARKSGNPYDYALAATGTGLFSIANLINDVTYVPYERYKPGWKNAPCRKGCNVGSF
jgi:hypothetical protein